MTNSPGWVQNRGPYWAAGGQVVARYAKLRVERRPFLAPKAVIFGVVFTGPYILVGITMNYSSKQACRIDPQLPALNIFMPRIMPYRLSGHFFGQDMASHDSVFNSSGCLATFSCQFVVTGLFQPHNISIF